MQFRKELQKQPSRILLYWLTGPFIYGMAVPLLFLDIATELYHRFSFPIYGLPYVKRGDYIRIDRHKLSYLSLIEKVHCAYCGYANGLLPYCARIAAESEKFWCAIMHKKYEGFHAPEHQKDFLPYGDKEAFEAYVNKD
ncbi:MAG: hypothetical protein WC052_03415 [Patescibacteria group bacterium]|jgi:hypothetical protein